MSNFYRSTIITAAITLVPTAVSAQREFLIGRTSSSSRYDYFVAIRKDHAAARPMFHVAVSLKDSWGRQASPS